MGRSGWGRTRARGLGVCAALAAAALIVAGCAGVERGPETPSPAEPQTPVSPSPPAPPDPDADEPAPNWRPLEADCHDPEAPAAPESFDSVHWEVPTGFSEDSGFTQLDPIEGAHQVRYLVSDEGRSGAEVLAVVHHQELRLGPVVDRCDVLDEHAVLERLDTYLERSGATRLDGPTAIEIDGATGYSEHLHYPERGFELRALWIYGRTSMLHVGCQWTRHQDRIDAGCSELIESIRIPS